MQPAYYVIDTATHTQVPANSEVLALHCWHLASSFPLIMVTESKNFKTPGTLHPGLWSYSLQSR